MLLLACLPSALLVAQTQPDDLPPDVKATDAPLGSRRIEFWNHTRKGTNADGADTSDVWFRAAKVAGIEFVRLSVAEMQGKQRDFLIGNADDWQGIPEGDLTQLVEVLDRAEQHGVRIVITMFSLPGCRWKQKNNDKFDYRLWHDKKYHQAAAEFWATLAQRLKGHPAIVGYNILNEPHPERELGMEEPSAEYAKWRRGVQGKAADINLFYKSVIGAIRRVDVGTPIVLDSCFHAHPDGLTSLRPVDDPAVLYSFHFYEPWNYTTFRVNKNRFAYPSRMPQGWSGRTLKWESEELSSRMDVVDAWAKRHAVPAKRVLVGEFGVSRRVEGASQYLADTIAAINQRDWHWAFYSFRSSTWDGMDYELGTQRLGQAYWEGRDAGRKHNDLIERKANPLWDVISQELKK
jgi:hypothetical protein